MRFLFPSMLWWALAALVPVALYLFRRRPRRVPVSSLLFFKALAREHQESAWLRRLKRLLSFLLTIAVIAGVVGALSRLVRAPSTGEVKSVVVLIDRSASMGAQDENGLTRLAAAKEQVRQRLAGLPGGVPVLLLGFDRQAEIIVPKSFDRRAIERGLDLVEVRPMESDMGPAMRLAAELAALEKPAAIWLASDTSAPETRGSDEVAVEQISVPLREPQNVGITGFDLRRRPLEFGQYEAFVQLQAVATKPVETKLEVRIDGVLTALRELTLVPGASENLLLPIDAKSGRTITLRLITAADHLAKDNEIHARIPEAKPIRVVWISPLADPFTELALTALGHEGALHVFKAGPAAWPPKEGVDVAIFQNWLPEQWPAEIPAIVINPPGAVGPVQAARLSSGLPVEDLRATRERHALLHGVATGRLILTQTATLAPDGPLEPIWTGPAGALMSAGEVRGQRVVVMGFAPEQSENLPLAASYPLLLGNSIQWAAQPALEGSGGRAHRAGDTLTLRGEKLTWVDAAGATRGETPLRNGLAWLDRAGLWQTEAGEFGSAALLSPTETLLPAGDASAEQARVRARWVRGDLGMALLWIVLGALVVESWLFHRHAVY
jgi:hypothetical protein